MQGTAKVLRKLDALKTNVNPSMSGGRTRRNLKALCTTTVDVMSDAYKNQVSVKTIMMEEGAMITASHPKLGFIEFGAGILHNSGTQYGEKFGFTPRSWSKEHERWLVEPKVTWAHGKWPLAHNVWVEGNAPADAFGVAEKTLREYAMKFMSKGFGR